MKAQSADYIALQSVYKTKARKDFAEVLRTVRRLEEQHGRTSPIDESAVELLCKNAAFLKLIRGQPLRIASQKAKIDWGNRAEYARQQLLDSTSLFPLHVAFLAYDIFRDAAEKTSSEDSSEADLSDLTRSPGYRSEDIPKDTEAMTSIARRILENLWQSTGGDYKTDVTTDEELQLAEKRTDQYVQELVRAGGSELHNISALTGGMVAQEIIKIITKQYVPVDNLCLFDGALSKAQQFRL